ncbi:ClC family H(+)/Cl(-) exchange transporter [Fischerella major NIES-592]|uniref:ClC family H(+)/Cl(-) exchange transporter n=1 Tax=Fischerella major NIES-592 TaxID=210994 RepID=A0A1U7H322_9CYAN|nr:H(+)/Cl(-) exchange transporter ClcA [Fischerella major]OKH15488.1 ClC family H(+)/Cl(-) exchange transporter [Fischerella major NIES-592]
MRFFNRLAERFAEARLKLDVVLIWAAISGLCIGLIATFLRHSVNFLILQRSLIAQAVTGYPVLAWFIPSLISGGMVSLSFWFMRRFAPETSGSGIPQVEGALDGVSTFRAFRVLPVKLFGGILSMGAGMVAGFEGPTIQMGSAIAKIVGSLAKTSQENLRILIAAGAGAGLTAAFNAPIAGILFITEEVRPRFESWTLAYRSVMVACVTATLTTRYFNGQNAFLKITQFDRVPLIDLWMFAMLGVGLGLLGYGFNFCLFRALDWFGQLQGIPHRLMGWWVGAAIGLLAWLSPLIAGSDYQVLTGSGEGAIFWSFNQEPSQSLLIFALVMRFVLVMFCYGSGAIGGIFAPMLSISTLFSLLVAREFNSWFPGQIPQPAVFAVAGMGGLVAATVRAPLTAMMLTMEFTDNYFVVLPLLMTCLFASMTAHLLGGEPVYSVLLKRACDKLQGKPQTDFV